MKNFILLLTALIWSLFAHGSTPDQPDWYQVEVIIFAQQDFYKNELPRRDVKLYYPANYLYLQEAAAQTGTSGENFAQISAMMHNQAQTTTSETGEIPYTLLAAEQRALNPDAHTLGRAPGYRVLFHQAWRQPVQNPKQTPWIIINGGETFDRHFELEGSLRLYQSRYLHLQTNLWKVHYRPASSTTFNESATATTMENRPWPQIPPVPAVAEPEITHSSQLFVRAEQRAPFLTADPRPAPFEIAEVVTLKTSHKLLPGQLQYLDHPLLGVLVLVTPYKKANNE